MTGFVFLSEHNVVAESFHVDDGFVSFYDEGENEELDLIELGLEVVLDMEGENGGPDYRRWERELLIAQRARPWR